MLAAALHGFFVFFYPLIEHYSSVVFLRRTSCHTSPAEPSEYLLLIDKSSWIE